MVRYDSVRILNTEMKDLDPEQTTPEVQVTSHKEGGPQTKRSWQWSSGGEASRQAMLPRPRAVFKALSMMLIHYCREAIVDHFAGEKMTKLRESQ